MLVFSTILPVVSSFTIEALIETSIEWVTSHAQPDFRIPGICWNGERKAVYKLESRRIKIDEYAAQNIAYVKYERTDSKGIIWSIDYVFNANDRKIAIALNRDYTPDALTTHTFFYPPEFVHLLIEKGYLEADGIFDINDSIHFVSPVELEQVVTRKAECSMPVVFVSRNGNFLNRERAIYLANRLRGIAHVIALEDDICNCEFVETNGNIGVYYPSSIMNHQLFSNDDDTVVDSVVSNVMQYCASQVIPEMYTVLGIEQAILFEDLSNSLQTSSNDMSMQELKEKVSRLSSENRALSAALIAKGSSEAILYRDTDRDLISYEIRGLVLIALKNAVESGNLGSRSEQVFSNLLHNKENARIINERNAYEKNVEKALISSNTKKGLEDELQRLGFEIARDDKHIIVRYGGDPNYQFTLSSTPSDIRSNKNAAKTILKNIK